MQYYIKESDWEFIYNALRREPGIHTQDLGKLKIFCEAIWYICRTGCQWRLLPYYYGDWRAIHSRFFRWAKRDIWDRLLAAMIKEPVNEFGNKHNFSCASNIRDRAGHIWDELRAI